MPLIPPKARLWLRRSHLLLALSTGLVASFVGLTGAMWAFHGEAEARLRPERQLAAHPEGAPLKVDGLLEALKARGLSPAPAELVEGPDPTNAWRLRLQDGTEWLVDPYAPKLYLWREAEAGMGDQLLKFHRFMGLDHDPGEAVTGYSTLGLLALLLSGLAMWQARRRFNLYQAHGALGALAALSLLASTSTGLALAFGDPTKAALAWATGTEAKVPKARKAVEGPRGVPYDRCVATAQARFPEGQVKALRFPMAPGMPLRVTLHRPDEWNRKGRSFAYVDPHQGELLGATDPREAPLAWRLYYLYVLPIHTGAWGGLAGRAWMALGALVPLALALSGLWLWVRRLTRLRASKARAAARTATHPS